MITSFVFTPPISLRPWKELASSIVHRYTQSKEKQLLCYGIANYFQGFARLPHNGWATAEASDSTTPSNQATTWSA